MVAPSSEAGSRPAPDASTQSSNSSFLERRRLGRHGRRIVAARPWDEGPSDFRPIAGSRAASYDPRPEGTPVMTAAAKTRWSWRPACPVSVGIWLAVVVLAFPLVPGAQAQSPYETPPGLIVGQGYRVGENVLTTGLVGALALEADVGILDAHGLDLLRIRIGELGAIRQLNALGYEEERRHLARKLNVDPCTTNPILSKKLTDVAWVTFSAREAVNLTTAVAMPYSSGAGGHG